MEENTVITLWPDQELERYFHIKVSLRALLPGIALAGSDNEKGYGGLSFRFGHAQSMKIITDNHELRATPTPLITGDEVDFHFQPSPKNWPTEISIACTVNNAPWHIWILRQELSMQNCAYPGRTPVNIREDTPLVLEATVRIRD